MDNLLDSQLFGIDKDSTLIEKALINHAVNQTNRMILLRMLSKVENVCIDALIEEFSKMDVQNLETELNRIDKYVKE
jgi:hypothetical protein